MAANDPKHAVYACVNAPASGGQADGHTFGSFTWYAATDLQEQVQALPTSCEECGDLVLAAASEAVFYEWVEDEMQRRERRALYPDFTPNWSTTIVKREVGRTLKNLGSDPLRLPTKTQPHVYLPHARALVTYTEKRGTYGDRLYILEMDTRE